MQYNFYTLNDKTLEATVMNYLQLKTKASREYANSGRSEAFGIIAAQTTQAYSDLARALDVSPPYLKSPSGYVRSVKIERSRGQTMLAISKPMRACANGLTEISEADYIALRHETMRCLGLLPKTLAGLRLRH